MLDLLIKGGEVIDGSGSPRYRGDVGVKDGRVTAVGVVDEAAAATIDASGHVVAPGFIDVHTHLDVQGFWDPTLSPSPLHGVTTALGGNCGFTVAPITEESAEYLMRMLARVEGMPLGSLETGVPWDWRTTAEFLDRVDGTLAINTGYSVGHSAIRRTVMGAAATERAATADELQRMCDLLRAGLAAGALGFSSSWSAGHLDADGSPVPSRYASSEEMVTLAAVCGEFEGTSLEMVPLGQGGSFPSHMVDLMVDMSVAAGRPLNWNLLAVTAETLPSWLDKLAVGTKAAERGGKVIGLVLPDVPRARFSFLAGVVLDGLPGWASAMSLPADEKLRLLQDPAERRRLDSLAQRSGPMKHMADWGTKYIVETFAPENKRFEGRLVHDIALEEGKYCLDALLDIACADDLKTLFSNEPHVDDASDWEARAKVFRDPRAVIGASDAGAHLDMMSTFNYTTTLLSDAVRTWGALSLEEGVQMLTSVPAALYGLRDRGSLTRGIVADIVIFDPDTVGSEPVTTVWDLPGGMPRLFAGATGIDAVIVNGRTIVRDGAFTGDIAGSLLRSGRDTATPSLT